MAGKELKVVALVPAAGQGKRLGGKTPKQFLLLHRVPLVTHTLRVLQATRSIQGIVVAVPPRDVERVSRLLARFHFNKVLATIPGGEERQESVWRGLQAVPEETELVLIHDAVRPLATSELMERVIREARRFGAATCGLPVPETVKRVRDGCVEETLNREGLWLTQTPQAFHRSLLFQAHEKARADGFLGTDDAVLVERLGVIVRMVPGLRENIKITTKDDLALAQTLLPRARMVRRSRP